MGGVLMWRGAQRLGVSVSPAGGSLKEPQAHRTQQAACGVAHLEEEVVQPTTLKVAVRVVQPACSDGGAHA